MERNYAKSNERIPLSGTFRGFIGGPSFPENLRKYAMNNALGIVTLSGLRYVVHPNKAWERPVAILQNAFG
jgi:hypothetical protein